MEDQSRDYKQLIFQKDSTLKPNIMDRYIVISNHTAEDCHLALEHFKEYHPGFLTHFEWGCYDNDHNAYAIIEAESHQEAKMAVPPLFRDKSKAIMLTHINPTLVEDPVHKINK